MIYTFTPYYKQVLWGGQKIQLYKQGLFPTGSTAVGGQENPSLLSNKVRPFSEQDSSVSGSEDGLNSGNQIGESWEISGLPGFESVVDYGPQKGTTLNNLVISQRSELMGAHNYSRFGNNFPLLIKFIDAQKDLSVQVHPHDKWAATHDCPNGKSELWYVIHAEPHTALYSGFSCTITRQELRDHIDRGTIESVLARHLIQAGDIFFLPAGRIHSIGAGALICEIQQSCDVTFRVYDFKRRGLDGKERELQVEQALEVVNLDISDSYRTQYRKELNSPVDITNRPEFKTRLYHVNRRVYLDYSLLDSFVILICVQGQGEIADNLGSMRHFSPGQTFLIPAVTSNITLNPACESRFLEVFIEP